MSYLVHLCPEAVLQALFGLAQGFGVPEGVEVGQDPHDTWEAVHLADIEELKRLHLEPKASIDQHQDLGRGMGSLALLKLHRYQLI